MLDYLLVREYIEYAYSVQEVYVDNIEATDNGFKGIFSHEYDAQCEFEFTVVDIINFLYSKTK